MQSLQLTQVVTHHVGPIDLLLKAGETVGLRGASGAGKSLLLRSIADLDPHRGEITLDGISQSTIEPAHWRSRVAYFAAESQWWSDRVIDHFTTIDTPSLESWLARAGFPADALHWSVHRLSTGEKQRLAIIRQLLHQPEVLLLDEPTASLDEENRTRMEQLLLDFQQQEHAALLWVSHDQQQLQRVSTHNYELNAGQLQEQNR